MAEGLQGFLSFFIYFILPYVATVFLLGGLAYRVAKWTSTRRPSTSLTIFPKHGNMTLIKDLLPDQLVFPRLAKHNRALWVFAFLFHASLAAILFGHLRLYQEPTWLWALLGLGAAGVDSFAFYAGGIAGVVFTVAIVGLLARRLQGIMKTISVPEDYVILGYLLAIALSGCYLRFFAGLSVPELQQYISGLLSFKLTLTPSVLNPFFVIHYLLVLSFLIYFPWSKLVHIAGSFITNFIVKR